MFLYIVQLDRRFLFARFLFELLFLTYLFSFMVGFAAAGAKDNLHNNGVAVNQEEIKKQVASLEAQLVKIKTSLNDSLMNLQRLQASLLQLNEKDYVLSTRIDGLKEKADNLQLELSKNWQSLQDLLQIQQSEINNLSINSKKISLVLGSFVKLQVDPVPVLFLKSKDASSAIRGIIVLDSFLPWLKQQAEEIKQALYLLNSRKKQLEEAYDKSLKLDSEQEALVEALLSARRDVELHQANAVEELRKEKNKKADFIFQIENLEALLKNLNMQQQASSMPANRIIKVVHWENKKLLKPAGGLLLNNQAPIKNASSNSTGVYWQLPANSAVYMPSNGKISYIGELSSYGKLIIIELGDEYQLVMAGFGKILVKVGEIISQGAIIGYMPQATELSKAANNKTKSSILYQELFQKGKTINIKQWWQP